MVFSETSVTVNESTPRNIPEEITAIKYAYRKLNILSCVRYRYATRVW